MVQEETEREKRLRLRQTQQREQQERRLQNEASSQIARFLIQRRLARSRRVAPMATVVRKSLSKWGVTGLSLTDTGFAKLHSKESKFEEGKKKYDLSSEHFKKFVDNLIEKIDRIHAVKDFSARISQNPDVNKFVLKEYSSITVEKMKDDRELRWPTTAVNHATQALCDAETDAQIKRSVVGNYIHESLTEAVKEQLKADEDQFIVTEINSGQKYFDGPSYFHLIARLVDPDNGHLVAKVKTQLRSLKAQDFNYHVQKTTAEFKNLKNKVKDLGGDYSKDDQFLDLWNCLRTMKEREFNRYVKQKEDDYSAASPANRNSIDEVIRDVNAKQTRMEAKGEWNVMSQEDTMVMALVGLIEKSNNNGKQRNGKSTKSNKAEKDKGKGEKSDKDSKKPLTSEEKAKLKESKIPDWKKEAPKDGEATSKEVQSRTYHWCKKCRNGKGMWAMHDKHDDNLQPSNKSKVKDGKSNTSSKSSSEKKKVSFNASTEADDSPEIRVRDDLLKNAKSYLAQFTDFQKGGTQG
jgi:hypothetical protein